jgi:predicted anti-sigma-YlaC factor YlaD
MSRIEHFHDRADARHVFGCPECRADARLARAWRTLAAPAPETPASEPFVAGVLRGVREDRARAARWRLGLVAAAALVFFFFAGLSHERATASPEPSVEDSYTSLPAPAAAVEGLLSD